jgi:hypothetical protein
MEKDEFEEIITFKALPALSAWPLTLTLFRKKRSKKCKQKRHFSQIVVLHCHS